MESSLLDISKIFALLLIEIVFINMSVKTISFISLRVEEILKKIGVR